MTAKEKEKGFATRAIHVGQEPDPLTGAVSVPIYPTSTYVQEEIGKNKGYEYARVSNPTRDRLEENLASLEGGIGSKVFASGMAAINAIATMFKSGDHVICGHNLYGGTPRLFNQVLANFGMEFTYVDTSDVNNVERAIRKNTRMVFVETPTNPLMALSDLQAIAKVCHARKVEVVVDNTFMSPYFQQPLALEQTWLCIPQQSSSMVIATDSAGSWSAPRKSSLKSWLSCKKPLARSCLHSSAGSFCAE